MQKTHKSFSPPTGPLNLKQQADFVDNIETYLLYHYLCEVLDATSAWGAGALLEAIHVIESQHVEVDHALEPPIASVLGILKAKCRDSLNI